MKSMKLFIVVLLVTLLMGCDITETSRIHASLEEYKCTSEQLENMEREMALCTETDYIASFCYRTIKRAQCEYVGIQSTNGE